MLNIGIIGCGYWSKKVLSEVKNNKNYHLTSIVCRDNSLEEEKFKNKIQIFRSIESLFNANINDCIYVAGTPDINLNATELAKKNGLSNLIYKLGDLEKVPLKDCSVDLALLSQSLHHAERPEIALFEANRILRPGGQLIVIDLKQHQFEKARQLYNDRWLGFAENDLFKTIKDAGFEKVKVEVVAKENAEPFFETLLDSGFKTV